MRLNICLLFSYVLLFVGCEYSRPTNPQKTVAKVNKELIPLNVLLDSIKARDEHVNWFRIDSDSSFIYLKAHASDYSEGLKKELITDHPLGNTGLICILAAQGLSLNEYISFVNSYLNKNSSGYDYFIYELMFPRYKKIDNRIVDNYDKPEIQQLCKRIIDSTSFSAELKNNIRAIKDGSTCKQIAQIKTMSASALIDSIEKDIGEFDFAGALTISPYFQYPYENPVNYTDGIVKIISSPTISFRKKYIGVYLLQKLPLNEYINFCNQSMKYFEKGIIEKRIMELLLFPVGWKTDQRLIMNYENPLVNQLLTTVINSKHFEKNFKEEFKKIRSGETYKQRQEMYSSGYRDN